MGEIKSTIDLVMERTRNLTLTDAERRNVKIKEQSEKARGLVRRYLDGVVDLSTLKSSLATIEREIPALREVLRDELHNHMEWDGDNERVLALFPELIGVGTDHLVALISEHRTEVEQERERRMDGLRRALAQKKIAGTALVPNPDADEDWQAYLHNRDDLFHKAIGELPFSHA